MPGRKPTHKQPVHKRVRPTPSVDLQYSKHTFDVNAWLGKYAERTVDREVHVLADRAPQAESPPQPIARDVTERSPEAPDSAK